MTHKSKQSPSRVAHPAGSADAVWGISEAVTTAAAAAPEGQADAIHERAMLVTLSVSMWTGRRFDKQISDEVNDTHAAGKDAGRYNKNLLGGKCDEYKAIRSAKTALRDLHMEMTLPWHDDGTRLLPTALYTRYTNAMRARRHDFEDAARAFVDAYPAIRESARIQLNGLYREEDYPRSVADRFRVSVGYAPIPRGSDLRVDLSEDERVHIAASVNVTVHENLNAAMREAWGRFHETVREIADRLTADPDVDGKLPIFRNALIDNARRTVGLLAALNIRQDPYLETLRVEADAILAGITTDELRENPIVRLNTGKAVQAIVDRMAAFYAPEAE